MKKLTDSTFMCECCEVQVMSVMKQTLILTLIK